MAKNDHFWHFWPNFVIFGHFWHFWQSPWGSVEGSKPPNLFPVPIIQVLNSVKFGHNFQIAPLNFEIKFFDVNFLKHWNFKFVKNLVKIKKTWLAGYRKWPWPNFMSKVDQKVAKITSFFENLENRQKVKFWSNGGSSQIWVTSKFTKWNKIFSKIVNFFKIFWQGWCPCF